MPCLDLGIYIKLCKFCTNFALIEKAHNLVDNPYGRIWVLCLVLSLTHHDFQQTTKCFLASLSHQEKEGLRTLFPKLSFSSMKLHLPTSEIRACLWRAILFLLLLLFTFQLLSFSKYHTKVGKIDTKYEEEKTNNNPTTQKQQC